MNKAYLKDKDDNIVYIFTQDSNHFSGKIERVTGWYTDENGEVAETDFFAELGIKWDGCSHWWFKGQDFEKDDDQDSYYHICGMDEYIMFIVGMLFAFKLAIQYLQDRPIDEEGKHRLTFDEGEANKFKQFEHMLNDYTIEVIE
jgi:hypothetical protein